MRTVDSDLLTISQGVLGVVKTLARNFGFFTLRFPCVHCDVYRVIFPALAFQTFGNLRVHLL